MLAYYGGNVTLLEDVTFAFVTEVACVTSAPRRRPRAPATPGWDGAGAHRRRPSMNQSVWYGPWPVARGGMR